MIRTVDQKNIVRLTRWAQHSRDWVHRLMNRYDRFMCYKLAKYGPVEYSPQKLMERKELQRQINKRNEQWFESED